MILIVLLSKCVPLTVAVSNTSQESLLLSLTGSKEK